MLISPNTGTVTNTVPAETQAAASSTAPVSGGGLGSIVGGIASAGLTGVANYMVADWQNKKNLEFWDKEKEYNSPKSQMQRLIDAGLNPRLIYGSGNVAGNLTSAPAAATMKGDIGLPEAIAAYQNVQTRDAQTTQIHAQTALTRQMADNAETENLIKKLNLKDSMEEYIINSARRKEGVSSHDAFNDKSIAQIMADVKAGRLDAAMLKGAIYFTDKFLSGGFSRGYR